ncbi:MAG: aminomethyl-transferring glycine dehydrogenase subunit GcvPB [Parachlamydiaceae bacterium]
MKTIFEKSEAGQKAYSLPKFDDHFTPPASLLRKAPLNLPEVSELNLTRHFSALAERNMAIDKNFYPLGSCTMKFNPRINEKAAMLPDFVNTHPLADEELVQGNLMVIRDLIAFLADITGFADGTLLPNAGAQGEYVGIRLIQSYHQKNRSDKDEILVPDAAHGTNPASARMAGYKIVSLKTSHSGDIDLDELRSKVSAKTAGLMLTNPNTLGLFSSNILEIASILHEHDALLYYDGANFNPMLCCVKPGEMGFDVMHINLHKTFSTPHGGGGPGSGPVLCSEKLKLFLPIPWISSDLKIVEEDPLSMGRIASFHGNFAVYLRAYQYCLLHGKKGLRRLGEIAVLNANYLKKHIEALFNVPFKMPCMHEFVVQADRFYPEIKALDLAKRFLDYGVHSPTVYFPQIVKECLLIEPTEAESLSTLDRFIEILKQIVEECETNPELVKTAPHKMPVGRLDETKANRELKLKH